jgi:hypothetical protein
LTISFYAKGNQDCIWTITRAGVTIQYVAACDFKNQTSADSFLNKLIAALNRKDTSLKFLVFVGHHWLSFPNPKFSNFFSIGYDTLRQLDDNSIFNYYWDKEKNEPLPIDTRNNPIDINSTNDRTITKSGIKIIYDIDYRMGEPVWQDLIKLIVYASNNLDQIKLLQKRDTVRYNSNGWYVSLLTLDTFQINKIIGRVNEPKHKEIVEEKPKSKNSYLLFGLLGLAVLGLVVYKSRQHSR